MAATAEKSRPAKKRATKSQADAPKKAGKSPTRDLDDAALAEYLLARPTIPDTSWSGRAGSKSRRKGESREAFIRRVLLGEDEEAAE